MTTMLYMLWFDGPGNFDLDLSLVLGMSFAVSFFMTSYSIQDTTVVSVQTDGLQHKNWPPR